jgi:hypothetical protein
MKLSGLVRGIRMEFSFVSIASGVALRFCISLLSFMVIG